jgi:hypothetical protein
VAEDLARPHLASHLQFVRARTGVSGPRGPSVEERCGSLQGIVADPCASVRLVCVHALPRLVVFDVQSGCSKGILGSHARYGMYGFSTRVKASSCSIGGRSEHYFQKESAERRYDDLLRDSGLPAPASPGDAYARQTQVVRQLLQAVKRRSRIG